MRRRLIKKLEDNDDKEEEWEMEQADSTSQSGAST